MQTRTLTILAVACLSACAADTAPTATRGHASRVETDSAEAHTIMTALRSVPARRCCVVTAPAW